MNPLMALFNWKVRGVRVVEIFGVAVLAAMVFSTYVAKAGAASQGVRIAEMERQIAAEHQRVRLLRAEVARLEQPARLEALSRSVGLAPVTPPRRASEDDLPRIAPEILPEIEPGPAPFKAEPAVAEGAQ